MLSRSELKGFKGVTKDRKDDESSVNRVGGVVSSAGLARLCSNQGTGARRQEAQERQGVRTRALEQHCTGAAAGALEF